MTESDAASTTLDRRDLLLALGIALSALVIYTLALAPDILYSDSSEFQTLAYTWGTTHPTGYPVYLILARIIGLIPVNTMAWRINFASALAAAVTLAAVYLIARHFISQRGGALLASVVLLLSYTFWSQSIIAEVYTPATAFISLVLLALLAWQAQPVKRRWLLFLAGFLLSLGLGVHLFLVLIAPSVFLYLLWGVLFGPPEERGRWSQVIRLTLGVAAGIAAFYLLFAFMDARPTPTSFYATTMIPSRDAWNLQEADFDTTLERFWISVSGVQWRDAMLPADADYRQAIETFFEDYLPREYTIPTLLLAILGVLAALLRYRRGLALIGSALVIAFIAATVYHPGDKYIFYLPVYLLLAVFAGVGAGTLLAFVARLLPSAGPRRIVLFGMTLVLVVLCTAPFVNTRWRALQSGQSAFVTENYAYPVNNLGEPRLAAECAVAKVAESAAFLVLEWRALYAIYYVAHVEQGRTGLVIREARPHGTPVMTENLRAEIAAQLEAGNAVYVDNNDPVLRRSYTLTRVNGTCSHYDLFKVSPRS